MNAMVQKVTIHFAALNGGDVVQAHTAALKRLWSLTFREAQVQTFSDAFLAITIIFAITTLLVPLLRKVGAPAAPSAEAH
jgi:DHA2 family multidrug resistance protein